MPYFKPFPAADESALKRFGGRAQTVVRRCTRASDGHVFQFGAVISYLQRLADSIAGQAAEAPQVRVCTIDVSNM
jgi:hypothetical protein